jgi:hypothetical protein
VAKEMRLDQKFSLGKNTSCHTMSRRLSNVSREEMQELNQALHNIYTNFCAFGAGQRGTDGMDNRTFMKFAKDCNLLDRKVTRTDIDLIFARIKLAGQRKINFKVFQEGVRQIAIKKGKTYQEVIMIAANMGGPSASGTTKVAAGQTRFHDDASTYTGVHVNGGPNTESSNVHDIGHIMDRSDYDIRGRKLDYEDGSNRHHHGNASVVSARKSQMGGQGGRSTASAVGRPAPARQSNRSAQGGGGGRDPGRPSENQIQQKRQQQQQQQQRQANWTYEDIEIHLRSQFRKFCAFGNKTQEMDSSKFVKFCRDCGIIPQMCTTTDADLCFTKAKDKRSMRLGFDSFMHVALPAMADRSGRTLEQVFSEIMRHSGPKQNNTTAVASGQTRFHDDKSTYGGGVHARGGPSTVDEQMTLENLADRGEFDVRGRKVKAGEGGGHLSSMLNQAEASGGGAYKATHAGEANKKGGVYDRLTDTSKYTGVYGKGAINGHASTSSGRGYAGDTNTGTNQNIKDISSTLRR